MPENTAGGRAQLEQLKEIKDSITALDGRMNSANTQQSQRLESINDRLTRQEEKFKSLEVAWDKAERRIFDVIGELRAIVEKVSSSLNSNGKVGLLERVTVVEIKHAALETDIAHNTERIDELESEARVHEGVQKQADHLWGRFQPFIPYIGGVLLAAAMYFIGKGAK